MQIDIAVFIFVDKYPLFIVDGVWEPWAEWGACNVSCGGGTRMRSRDCYGPFFDGAECPGSNTSAEDCNTHECPSKF